MLVDGCDTILLGNDGVGHNHLFAVQNDFAAVGLMHARERLDESGLTGAVFTHQRVDLARLQVKANLIKRFNAGEDLRDVIEFEYVFRHAITSA